MDADAAAIQAALRELGEELDVSAGYSVFPKTFCPHIQGQTLHTPAQLSIDVKCSACGEDEVWICGGCGEALCSRYKNQHMVKHSEETSHAVGLSLSDLSFWCFQCDSYLDVYAIPELHALYSAAHVAKFGSAPALPSASSGAAGSGGGGGASSSSASGSGPSGSGGASGSGATGSGGP
eukprot:TRINITY_DN123186_c0_g1_i1.p1 TRINITY_DN123186_c0_g1~~TRINITY_DN123186_c0_g1_i1.p1  ORF type:complete len:188 (+),score=28.76 TRINITY_DN123186_c0_g1_i1:29-565(+)